MWWGYTYVSRLHLFITNVFTTYITTQKLVSEVINQDVFQGCNVSYILSKHVAKEVDKMCI